MGLVRRGRDRGEGRGEDKGQNRRRRLEEDQTEQMCGNGKVRTEREDDECRPESICCDSLSTLSASRSPSQLKVMSRQTNLADITHLMFAQQQMDHTWWLLFVIRSGWREENREGKGGNGPHRTVTNAENNPVYIFRDVDLLWWWLALLRSEGGSAVMPLWCSKTPQSRWL